MASVTLQAGPFTVQIEDEDETAKKVTRLAHNELIDLLTNIEVPEEGGSNDEQVTHAMCGQSMHRTNLEIHAAACVGEG